MFIRLFFEGEVIDFEVPNYPVEDISGIDPSLWIDPEMTPEPSETIKKIFQIHLKKLKVPFLLGDVDSDTTFEGIGLIDEINGNISMFRFLIVSYKELVG